MRNQKLLTAGLLFALPVTASAVDVPVFSEDMSSTETAFDESIFNTAGDPDGNLFPMVSHNSTGGNPDDNLTIDHFYDPVDDPTVADIEDYSFTSFYVYNLFTWDPSTDGDIVDVSFSLDVENGGEDIELFFIVDSATGAVADGFQFVSSTSGFETFTAPDLTFFGADLNDDGPVQFGFAISTFVFDVRDNDTDPYDGDQFSVNVDNFAVTVTAVPEPASLAIFAIGGLCFTRRRR